MSQGDSGKRENRERVKEQGNKEKMRWKIVGKGKKREKEGFKWI